MKAWEVTQKVLEVRNGSGAHHCHTYFITQSSVTWSLFRAREEGDAILYSIVFLCCKEEKKNMRTIVYWKKIVLHDILLYVMCL